MHLNYKHYPMVCLAGIHKNQRSYKSAILRYIRLKFAKYVHLDVFYNIHSGFFRKSFFFAYIVFRKFVKDSFSLLFLIQDSNLVGQ